ncbi:MAG: hypothetical protein CL760_05890 [Chloroflexi bacterium]|nr:hypothetical protein [Chloroflexota bacterium]|tara:strand:+ start:739 stop:1215 length:477 start_codon:yes stop_codon:yes gene_type:complete
MKKENIEFFEKRFDAMTKEEKEIYSNIFFEAFDKTHEDVKKECFRIHTIVSRKKSFSLNEHIKNEKKLIALKKIDNDLIKIKFCYFYEYLYPNKKQVNIEKTMKDFMVDFSKGCLPLEDKYKEILGQHIIDSYIVSMNKRKQKTENKNKEKNNNLKPR